MQKLHFPVPSLRVKKENDTVMVWDVVRKKWVVLTPEEWVRQHLMHYMQSELDCPFSLMAVEKSLQFNGMTKRSDLVIYSDSLQPLLLAECKAPEIQVNQSVFEQAAMYNRTLGVPFLLVTNGVQTFCCRIDQSSGTYSYLTDIPRYSEMTSIL